jgi:hypothetical protein
MAANRPDWRAVGRSPVVAIGLAAGLLALPLMTPSNSAFGGLGFAALEALLLPGVALGWVAADRLAALRIPSLAIAAIVTAGGIGAWFVARQILFTEIGQARTAVTVLAIAVAGGALVRGTTFDRRSLASVVAIAAMTSWLTYDLPRVTFRPLQDLHLYLGAFSSASAGASPYLRTPLTELAELAQPPFVYPPLTIPVFRFLARIPLPVAEGLWLVAMLAAALGGLWLLGVRGRWLVAMLGWPPIAIGVSVGNVGMVSFLLLAAGFWVGALLIVGGVFKPQSLIPALWLVRHGRWRAIALGAGIVLALALVTLPLTGLQAWFDWVASLGHFQATTDRFPAMKGFSLTRSLPAVIAILFGLVAVGLALLGRGRNGLARLGAASVVASPTLYLHGLTAILPGTLALRPELLWFVLGLGPWIGTGSSAWLAVGIVFVSLLIAGSDDLPIPSDLSPGEADIHPAGQAQRVWPERGEARPGQPS